MRIKFLRIYRYSSHFTVSRCSQDKIVHTHDNCFKFYYSKFQISKFKNYIILWIPSSSLWILWIRSYMTNHYNLLQFVILWYFQLAKSIISVLIKVPSKRRTMKKSCKKLYACRYNSLSYTHMLGIAPLHQLQALVRITGGVQHVTKIYPKVRKIKIPVFLFLFHFLYNYPTLYDWWLLWNWEYQTDSHPL